MQEGCARAAETGDTPDRVLRLCGPSEGQVRWVSLKTAPVIDRDTPIGMVGTLEDISRRRATEEALARYYAKIEQAIELAEKQASNLARQAAELALARDEALAATRAKSEFLAVM